MTYFVTNDSGFKAPNVTVIPELPIELLNSNPKMVWADTETTGLNPLVNKMLLLIFTIDDDIYVIDCRTTNEHIKITKAWETNNWVFHNAQFDVGFIYSGTSVLLRNIHCTYEREKIIYNNDNDERGIYSLAALTKKYVNISLSKETRNSFINKPDLDPFTPEEILYAAADVKYLKPIYEAQEPLANQFSYLIYIERKFISVATEMTMRGFRFDVNAWRNNIKRNREQMLKYADLLKEELIKLSEHYPVLNQRYKAYQPKHVKKGYEQTQMAFDFEFDTNAVLNQINLNSSDHIQKIFKACGAYIPDANANTLKEYYLKNPDTPLANFILLLVGDEQKHSPCYKFYEKALSTYGEKFIQDHAYYRNGAYYIHTKFNLVETKTGRLSSENPNLQNIPAIKDFRHAFIAEPGKIIYTIDFTGCELAICAYQSGCPTVTASINEGLDLHSMMATISYRIIKNDPNFIVSKSENKELRNKHKPVLFGILYGAGPTRIASVLNIDKTTATKVYNALREALPVLFTYLDGSSKFATTNRYIQANHVTKRRQYFTNKEKEDYKIEKEAKNYPMQATNADLIKEAICTLDAYIRKNNLDIQILLTVHDEIVFQAPADKPEYKDILKSIMENVATKYVPGVNLTCSVEVGPSWTK